MEKVWTLLWILFAIGAFIFRTLKKVQENSAQESRERSLRPGGAVPDLPTASFQEMLRQMQTRNSGEAAPVVPTPNPAGPLTLGGRPMPREIARPVRSQERTKVQTVSLEAPSVAISRNAPAPVARRAAGLPRASAGTGNRPSATAPATGTVGATVRQWLSQPESVRAAFVLSEVLRRKY